MKKTEQDLNLSGAYRAKLAHSCASGADWKSFRVGATSRERRRMQSSGKVSRFAFSSAQGFGK
jgi:hypothetical protein